MPHVAAISSSSEALSDRALCIGCNYPLRGLTENRCPECGRPFDPRDRDTLNLGDPLGPAARFILHPPAWWFTMIVAVPSVPLLVLAIDPGAHYMPLIVLVTAFYVATIVFPFVIHAVVRVQVARVHRQPEPPYLTDRRVVQKLSQVMVIVALCVIFRLPLYAAFWVSKPWLDDLAQEYERDPTVPDYRGNGPAFTSRRAGLFTVDRAWRIEKGLMFDVSSGSGFAYIPGGTVRGHYNAGSDGYLGAGWWWYTED